MKFPVRNRAYFTDLMYDRGFKIMTKVAFVFHLSHYHVGVIELGGVNRITY